MHNISIFSVLSFIQPLKFVKVVTPHLPSDSVSKKTLRQRSHEMADFRGIISGNCPLPQLASELNELPREEREKLIKPLSIRISAEHSLAMKADLQIPWNKLRTI